MTRATYIERLRRGVYGDFPPDEATITDNLINEYLTDGLAIAAKANYTDNLKLEAVGFVNNSFYSTFKGIAITKDETNLYKFSLPQIPIGIGSTEGLGRVVFKNDKNQISYTAVPLSENQTGYHRSMRAIPGKVLIYPEGGECFVITTINMTEYTAQATIISGGDANDLESTLNVPQDYIPMISAYILEQLTKQRSMPVDGANDGSDFIRQT